MMSDHAAHAQLAAYPVQSPERSAVALEGDKSRFAPPKTPQKRPENRRERVSGWRIGSFVELLTGMFSGRVGPGSWPTSVVREAIHAATNLPCNGLAVRWAPQEAC